MQAVGIAFLVLSCFVGSLHPLWPVGMVIGGILSSVLTFLLPVSFPALFVLALTAGDLYPLTGSLTVQEFDSLLFGGVAGVLLRGQNTAQDFRTRLDFHGYAWGLFWASLALGVLIGIWRLPKAPWGDELSVYFTRWNVVRIAKGYFLGGAFLFFTMGLVRERVSAWKKSFCLGMEIAALYVGGVVILERAIFPGLWNFNTVYRAAGPFFTMHIGDHHLDAFLVLSFPFVLARFHRGIGARGVFNKAGSMAVAVCLSALVVHAAIATMSRVTIFVIGLEALVWSVLVFVLGNAKKETPLSGRFGVLHGLFLTLFTFAVIGAMIGSYWMLPAIRTRFDSVTADLETRQSHGELTIREARTGIGGVILGHGVGTVPSMIASDMGLVWPPLSWSVKDGKGIIEVQGGWRLSLARLGCFDASKGSLRVRSLDGGAGGLECGCVEQSILEEIREPGLRVAVSGMDSRIMDFPSDTSSHEDDRWVDESVNPMARWRPRVTSIRGFGGGAVLENGTGNVEWISPKSSFPWFFVSKNHLIWRTKNFLSSAYYEQGVIGVIGWLAVLASTCWLLYSALFRHKLPLDPCSKGSAVAFLGFVSLAMVATLIDTPWIVAMFLACLSLLRIDSQCNDMC